MKLLNDVISSLVQVNAFSRSFLTVIFATAALSLAVSCGKKDDDTSTPDDKGKAKAEKECEDKLDTHEVNEVDGEFVCKEKDPDPTETATLKTFTFNKAAYENITFKADTKIEMKTSFKVFDTSQETPEEVNHKTLTATITANTATKVTTMSMPKADFDKIVSGAATTTDKSEFKIMLKVSGSSTQATLTGSTAYTFLMGYANATNTDEFDKPFTKTDKKEDHAKLAVELERIDDDSSQ